MVQSTKGGGAAMVHATHVLHVVFGSLFFLAAVVQYNDPDPERWIPYYGGTALLAFCALSNLKEGPLQPVLLILLLGLIGVSAHWSLQLWPAVRDAWVKTPNLHTLLIGEGSARDNWTMQGGAYTEEARELGGIAITLMYLTLVLLPSFIASSRKQPKRRD